MSTIHSMTGFASLRTTCSAGTLTIDLKSVNYRYFEVFFKLPDNLRQLESELRDRIREVAPRGKFECYLTFTPNEKQGLTLNTALVDTLTAHLKTIKDKAPDAVINAVDILNFPGVLIEDAQASEAVDSALREGFTRVLCDFTQNRGREGERLKQVILDRLSAMEELLTVIRDNLAHLVEQERVRLREKIAALKTDIPAERFEAEVALLAQKSDIAEEYDRLQSHIKEVRSILSKGGSCGKRLDFMMQEFNREANTMASKASNLDITRVAVELKVLIEQMREQVQNIE